MEETNLVLFDDGDLEAVFKSAKLKIQEIGEEKGVYSISNEPKVCEGCGIPITLSNLGHIVYGSNKIYCKNPSCFGHYIANNKID